MPTDRNQLSWTLVTGGLAGDRSVLLEEAWVHYRFQAVGVGGEGPVAVAPRLSLSIPTGSLGKEANRGVFGLEGAIPVSIEQGRWFVLHLNAGLAIFPGAWNDRSRKTLWEPFAGFAVGWQPVTWFNLLLEALWTSPEEADAGSFRRRHQATLAPGVRFAIDHAASGLQVVPGVAARLDFDVHRGVFRSRDLEVGMIFYLSLEHPAWKAPDKACIDGRADDDQTSLWARPGKEG